MKKQLDNLRQSGEAADSLSIVLAEKDQQLMAWDGKMDTLKIAMEMCRMDLIAAQDEAARLGSCPDWTKPN